MSELVSSSWFWAMMQCLVVAVTAVLLLAQVRAQTSSHIVVASEAILVRWNSPSTLRLRRTVATQGLAGDSSFNASAQALAEIIENLAMYMRHRAVPDAVLWSLLSWSVEHYYQLFKNGIEQERHAFKDPTLFSGIIKLDRRFKSISGRSGASIFDRTDDEMRKFLTYEANYCDAVLSAGQ